MDTVLSSQEIIAQRGSTEGKIGNIRHIAQFAPVTKGTRFDLALGFGADEKKATLAADATLKSGYATTLAKYNGQGRYVGWEDYLTTLSALKSLVPMTGDKGKLLFASALMLKVQEDRTYSGALIASLSNPWGDTTYSDVSSTGYKAVWPRDFYQVSMALLALGDKETPVAAHRYLPTVQVGPETKGNTGDGGWFLQKSHVDGTPEWIGIQLDQTAMPILLAARLNSMGLLSDKELTSSYGSSLKRAANFLSYGGTIGLDWNTAKITPPYAQQERWEEQEGHSPSTTAAVISGLVAASHIATRAKDDAGAKVFADKAKDFSDKLEQRLYTTNGMVTGTPSSYYLRISRSDDANAPGTQDSRNGRKVMASDLMIDQGFIELVRYGVRSADDQKIVNSLKVIDDQTLPENLRVRYDLSYGSTKVPGFRRYGNDGYGDRENGGNYSEGNIMHPDQRGRVWPIFTGERGHYELALANKKSGGATKADIDAIKASYVVGMELMANEGLMIPEQVFEGVGVAGPHNYVSGEGTNSATPLAWSHAEYIKLLRSLRDKAVWDENPETAKAFGNN
jgi:glucoamylase